MCILNGILLMFDRFCDTLVNFVFIITIKTIDNGSFFPLDNDLMTSVVLHE